MHLGGTNQIVSQPEFTDHEKLSELLEFLEQRKKIVPWLHNREHSNKVSVTIGHEHDQNGILGCSVVTSTYTIGNITGVIGVIGPTRMPYSRLISIVGYTSRLISTIFN